MTVRNEPRPGATNTDRRGARDPGGSSASAIRRNLLFPLAVVFALLVAIIVGTAYIHERSMRLDDLSRRAADVQDFFALQVEKDVGRLHALIDTFVDRGDILAVFAARDRDRLLALTKPLFDHLKADNAVTHFYFTGVEGINFLRVHQPELYGDRIERFTQLAAERTGKLASGIEFGPLGTLTLRVVRPVREGGRLIGYIELGEEIGHLISHTAEIADAHILVTLYKDYLKRPVWEAGMRRLGRDADWNRFADVVVIVEPGDSLPAEVYTLINRRDGENGDLRTSIEDGGRILDVASAPISDAGGREVGDLVMVFDATDAEGRFIRHSLVVAGITLSLGLLLYVLFHGLAKRAEAEIDETRILLRRNLEQQETAARILELSLEGLPLREMIGRALTLVLATESMRLEAKGTAFLVDEKEGGLVMVAHSGVSDELVEGCHRVPFGRCLCGRAAESGEMLHRAHIDADHETTYEDMVPHGHYCVPIRSENAVLGVLNLYVEAGHVSEESTENFLRTVCGILGGLIEKERFERAREQSEARLRILAESTLDAIILIGEEGVIGLWNPAAESMFGYSAEEAVGGRVQDLIIPERYRLGHEEGFNKFRETGEGAVVGGTVELDACRRDGSEFPVELSISAMKLGNAWGAVGVIRDISGRLKNEAELRQAQKMRAMGSLAGGMAHEINNMLLPILSLSEMTMKSLPEDGREHRRLEKVVEAARRARDLVERVRLFGSDAQTERREADVHAAVLVALDAVRTKLPETVSLGERLDPGTGRLLADEEQIAALTRELLSNAVDAMEAGTGELEVVLERVRADAALADRVPDLKPDQDYARLAVRDTGTGMDDDVLERVFDPFFTTKEVGKGTGLGLSIVHGIVGGLDGAVSITSEPGKGTTFEAYLPLLNAD